MVVFKTSPVGVEHLSYVNSFFLFQLINIHVGYEVKTLFTCDPGSYAKIKSNSVPRVGEPRDPIAELTLFGRTIMSPGAKTNLSSVLSRSSSRTTDYK